MYMYTLYMFNKAVNSENDDNAWADLYNFDSKFHCLHQKGSKRRKLSSMLIRRINSGSMDSEGFQSTPPFFRKKSPEATKAAAVSSILEDGNISAAAIIICSIDTPSVFCADNLEKLKHKYPLKNNKIRVQPSSDVMPALQIYEEKVPGAIRSFPAGSAAGSEWNSTSTFSRPDPVARSRFSSPHFCRRFC